MDDLETLQKLWQDRTNSLIDPDGTKTAADDQDNRLLVGKTAESKSLFFAALKKLLADRRTGQNAFVLWQML